MEMHIGHNCFSFLSFDTHKGNFPKSEVVVTVRMIKKLQATPAVTRFWATIYKSIIGDSEKLSDLPKVRYAEMNRIEVAFAHGGAVSSVLVRDSPPPPPPGPPGPLSYQGSMATDHTNGGAEGARDFFFIPLAHVASLPAQAVEHPNAILEPNLDSNAHPNPQPAPNPTPNPTHDPNQD